MAETFATLLELEGFTVTAGMVHGLALREEWQALSAFTRGRSAASARNGGGR